MNFMNYTANIQSIKRYFLPADFQVRDWKGLEPYLKELLERAIHSKEDLEKWMKDASELETVISEDANWRQIRMTCDTENKELENAFVYFVTQIQPPLQNYADKLNRKLVNCPYINELEKGKYFTYLRNVKKALSFFAKKTSR